MDLLTILDAPKKKKFTPAKLPNLLAWYRSDKGITLNGSNVSAWADQSGNGRHLAMGTAARQPAYSAADAVFNSRPSITTDGVDDALSASNVWPAGASDISIVLIASDPTSTGGEWLCEQSGGGDQAYHFYSPALQFKRWSSGPGVTIPAVNTKSLLIYQGSGSGAGSTESIAVNNSAPVTSTNTRTAAAGNRILVVGAANTTSFLPRKAAYAELFIVAGLLTATQIAAIKKYAASLYGSF